MTQHEDTHKPNADHCDGCGGIDQTQVKKSESGEQPVGPIHWLRTAGDGGVNLCRACWDREMAWRHGRNRGNTRYGADAVANPYDIIPFPTGGVT